MSNQDLKTILLVEDEIIIALESAETIRSLGYKVVIAYSGKDAVRIATENKDINLILMDIDLGKDTDITEIIQSMCENKELPIVFLSNYTEPEMVKKTEKITSYGYVMKEANIYILGASIITALKLFEADQKIKESEEKYHNLYNSAALGIFQSTFDGRFIDVNPALARMLGYDSPEEVVSQITNISEQIYAEPLKRDAIVDKLLKEGGYLMAENHYLRKDGSSWYGKLQSRVVPDKHGKPSHLEGFIEDITVRKKTEENLLESHQFISQIIKSVEEGIIVYDLNMRYQVWNPFMEKLTGISESQVLGKHPSDFFPVLETAGIIQNLKKALNGDTTISDDFPFLIHATGKKGWVSDTSAPLRNAKGEIIGVIGTVRDMSARKQLEETIKDSEEKYHSYIENAPDGIFASNSKGFFQEVNAKGCLLLGYSRDEILSMNTSQIVAKEYVEKAANELNTLKNEGGFTAERNFLRKDGSTFFGLLSAVKINENRYLGFLKDVTKRKQAEVSLRESEERHKRITAGLTDYLYTVIINNGQVVETIHDESCLTVTGYTSKEFLEDNFLWVKMVDPQDNELVVSSLKKISEGKQLLPIEHRVICKNGDVRWISNTTFLKYDSNGKLISYDGVIKDITERKRVEEKLRETNEYLENLFNYANGPIIVWNNDFEITRFNHAFEKLSGYHASEVILKQIDILFPQEKFGYLSKLIEKTIAGEKWKTVEIEILRKDKEIRTVLWNSANILDNKREKIIATIAQGQDITEQKQAEAKLLNHATQIEQKNYEMNMALYSAKIATTSANEMAIQAELANKSKSVFLANMSHEIRTPLNAIIGFSQLMNREQQLTSTQKDYNNSIIRAGEHLLELIDDILELSKVEAGRVILNPTHVNLFSLLEEIKMIFKGRAQSKKLQFILDMASDLPQFIVVDENKLRRIFINLIGNAVKFTDQGGIAVRVRVDPISENTSHLVVEIQDSGSGIHENELPSLFQHFVQTSSGFKKGSGTGLGLAISQELAHLMGGYITVSSQVGRGSIFTFQVKIKEEKTAFIEKKNTKRIIYIKSNQRSFRILVVDDKKENLQIVVNLLMSVGFETKEAFNGEDAIAKFEEWKPDLILMDLRMPVMDGYEATRCIRSMEQGIQTPIVALSASTFEGGQNKIESMQIQGYIRKPFREDELFNTVGKILDIEYIYEDETSSSQTENIIYNEILSEDITKLPNHLVMQMIEVIAVADINQLKKLINSIDADNAEIAKYLMNHAQNFNYEYLQKILSKKEANE